MQIEINFEEEIWLPVKNFEPRFKISNYGRLLSIGGKYGGEFILSPYIDSQGYHATNLRMKPFNRRVRIHTLVAETFVNNPDLIKNIFVNHLDGNKLNNFYKNLEWTTPLGNNQHAIRTGLLDLRGSKSSNAKLTESDVLMMRSMYPQKTHKEISNIYGITRRHVGDIINRINWKHI